MLEEIVVTLQNNYIPEILITALAAFLGAFFAYHFNKKNNEEQREKDKELEKQNIKAKTSAQKDIIINILEHLKETTRSGDNTQNDNKRVIENNQILSQDLSESILKIIENENQIGNVNNEKFTDAYKQTLFLNKLYKNFNFSPGDQDKVLDKLKEIEKYFE